MGLKKTNIFDEDTEFDWEDGEEISPEFEFLENLWFFVNSKHGKDVKRFIKLAEKLEKKGDITSKSIDDFLISIGENKRPPKPKPKIRSNC
jgi:hypothetical protein